MIGVFPIFDTNLSCIPLLEGKEKGTRVRAPIYSMAEKRGELFMYVLIFSLYVERGQGWGESVARAGSARLGFFSDIGAFL